MMTDSSKSLEFRVDGVRDDALRITVAGRLDARTTGSIWRRALADIDKVKAADIVVDASGVDYCDGSGIALLLFIQNRQTARRGKFTVAGLRPEFRAMLDDAASGEPGIAAVVAERESNFAEQVGEAMFELWEDIRSVISFIGELTLALAQAAWHPRRVRWADTVRIAEKLGVDALPIVALIGFLMGLIMAFQAAVPLGQFGAQIFVANLIGLAVLRELGPLMTAIVLAGRSGSAFAAELGTMKVREEIDALKTMGLEPVRFLVVPRVIAALVMTPLLTIFADLVGVMGGSVVLLSLGFPLITFFNQLQSAVTYGSPVGGLIKAFVFGVLVAAIGCLRGLQTQTGASAVGDSTTRAVVSSIILIVITDGIFTIIYYYLRV